MILPLLSAPSSFLTERGFGRAEIRSWNLHLRKQVDPRSVVDVEPDYSRLAPVLRTLLPVGALSVR
jgi:hypothetical protein